MTLNAKEDGSLDVHIFADAISISHNQAQKGHLAANPTQTSQQLVHILARNIIDAFAQYSVFKAGSIQS
ncbi:hypothetical protein NL530_28385, partial [Klebsiella pneumoniae]|nr:hypothetical protein [Klebsiella pneumoniae]